MRRLARRSALAVVYAAALGCGSAQAPLSPRADAPSAGPVATPAASAARRAADAAFRQTPDAPFRASAPPVADPPPFDPPAVRTLRLKNQIPVYFIQRPSLHLLRVTVLGTGLVPATERPGARTLMMAALDSGTPTLATSDDVRGAFLRELAQYSTGSDDLAASVALGTRAENADATLALLADVVQRPTFPASSVEWYRARFVAEYGHDRRPRLLAQRALRAAFFPTGANPEAGRDGAPIDFAGLTRDDVVRAHQAVFTPASTAIAVAGDIEEGALLEILNRTFGTWTAARGAAATPPLARLVTPRPPRPTTDPKAAAPRLIVLDRPRAPEAQLAIGSIASDQIMADWWALATLRAVMMDAGRGRLTHSLHDGTQLNAKLSLDASTTPAGVFVELHADFATELAAEATAALRTKLQRLADEPVPAAELATVKAGITRSVPSWFETNTQLVATMTSLLHRYETPREYGARQQRRDAVSSADVQRVARRAFAGASPVYVVVGDWSRLRDAMTPLGWSSIEVHAEQP